MVLGVLLLSALFVALYWYGFASLRANFATREGTGDLPLIPFPQFASAMVLLGLYTVNFLSGVMAIFASVGSVAAEIDAGTFHAIVPKPIRRWEIVLGKWLGYGGMLAVYVSLMCASVLLVSRYNGGYVPPNQVYGSALIVLVSLLLLSLTVLGSTFFSSLTNGIIVFMLYGVALTGGLVEQIGNLVPNETLKNIGVATSLVIPSDVIWRLASSVMQPSSFTVPLNPTSLLTSAPPSAWMMFYAIGYTLACLGLSTWVFSRRDL
jgi:ABC-type transport system involved in multi-copper enzyme maturation permease subunit